MVNSFTSVLELQRWSCRPARSRLTSINASKAVLKAKVLAVQYPSIRIEGSILSGDIIDAIEQGEKGFQKAKDFGLEPTSKVKDEIANAWADARDQWRIYRRKVDNLKEGKTGTTETRNFWMVPFLGLLGFQPDLARKGEDVHGRNYVISHRDPTVSYTHLTLPTTPYV